MTTPRPSAAHKIIATCLEHDYNRTFHDTALCVLADLDRAGYDVIKRDSLCKTSGDIRCLNPCPCYPATPD